MKSKIVYPTAIFFALFWGILNIYAQSTDTKNVYSTNPDPNFKGIEKNASSSGYEEKKLVEDLLQTMAAGGSVNTNLRKYIAPSYYTTYNLSKDSYYIDNYTIKGFSIISYDSQNSLVITEVWGEGKSWTHQLTFKVVKEYGNLYVYPEKHSSTYIKPWYRVGAYINKEVTNTLSSSG